MLLPLLALLATVPASPGAAATAAAPATTLTIDLDRALVRGFNRDGFIVSGVYPATLRGDRLRLPDGDARGGLFLHAGMHRLTLDRFALRDGGRALRARVGTRSVVLARGSTSRFTLTRAGAHALRAQLHTARPVAGAPLGRVSATRPR
ncbi:hypothetical protein VSS74_17490 [Conexibacter stalactiti]|uniref:FecR protein domain-containing protein n=1 Tax=Conexibacter stalactiti TaxID=1940611 RepID=A0ABU4HSC9_9ACTN|nr:hypothetical protein [Conexibacter stalactiti]MDW5596145.1 hypothetical protein [Conexibacter stalactiti]MEC5036787.1 hypothetical protein [Conexibacter stalactiti]